MKQQFSWEDYSCNNALRVPSHFCGFYACLVLHECNPKSAIALLSVSHSCVRHVVLLLPYLLGLQLWCVDILCSYLHSMTVHYHICMICLFFNLRYSHTVSHNTVLRYCKHIAWLCFVLLSHKTKWKHAIMVMPFSSQYWFVMA